MAERYSTFYLKIKALADMSTLYEYPAAPVWGIRGGQELNAAGTGTFQFYASELDLLEKVGQYVGQAVTIYVIDQVASGSGEMDLATFTIKNVTTETEAGVSVVTVSGPEITDQLRNTNAGDNAIDNGSGGVSTTDITAIMGYASSGWTLTNETATASGTYHAARGDTVLSLLISAAQQSGEIFRLTTYANPSSKGLYWADAPDSSGVTLYMPSSYNEYDGYTNVGKLYSLRREFDFEPVITRIRPYGAGVGDGRLDITGITASNTGADPAWLDTTFASNLMVNATLEASLSYVIAQDIDFPWIQANDPTNATQLITAAVALWKTGKNYLEQNDSERKFYTAVCNVPTNIRPGQNLTVFYQEYEGGRVGGDLTIDDNLVLTVLSVENTFEGGERITTLLLGDKPLPKPTAAGWVADVAEKTQATTRKSDVGTSPGSVSVGRTINATQPVRIDGGASADLSADRTISLNGLSSVGSANQIPGTNAGATAWEYKTVSGGVSHGANSIVVHAQSHVLASTSGLGADHTVSGLTSGQVLRATGSTTAAFGSLQATDLPSHVLATNTALGSQHTISGATAGHVLRASSATAAAFAQLQHSDLGGVSANQHHNQSHVLATTSALGSDHTVSGLTSGQVLKATGSTAARFVQLLHSELGSVGANDHHNQSHVLASTSGLGADHTVSGLTARQVLIATGSTTALFRALQAADLPTGATLSVSSTSSGDSHAITSSSDPGAVASLLATDSNGAIFTRGVTAHAGTNTDSNASGSLLIAIGGNTSTSQQSASAAYNAFVYSSTADHIPAFRGRKSLGTRSSPTAVGSGTVLARFGGAGWNGSAFPTESNAYIEMRATETHGGSAAGSHIRFGTTPDGSTTSAEVARLEGTGRLLIAETSNAYQTIGVTVNMATNTNEIATYKQSNVAHGMTSVTDTDTFGAISIRSGTQGGMVVAGYHEGTTGLELNGVGVTDLTGKASASEAYLHLNARKKSGAGATTPGANANLVAIRKDGTTVWIVDTEGDVHRDGSDNTFDIYHDAHLARAFDMVVSPGAVIDSEFDAWVQYGRADLVAAGILHESGFYNESRLLRLAIGAVWQEYTERQHLTRRVNELEQRLLN